MSSRGADRHSQTESMVRALGRMWRLMLPVANRVAARRKVPLIYWQLVSGIAYDGLHSQVALSRRVLHDPAQTSRALTQLEQLGWVQRKRSKDDKRRIAINLTAAGRRWYESMRAEVMGEMRALFAHLDANERETLEDMLLKLTPAPGVHSS